MTYSNSLKSVRYLFEMLHTILWCSWKESLITDFSNQVFLTTQLMTSFFKIKLNFVIKCFIFFFLNCNNSENLLRNHWTHVKKILYSFSIACFRTECLAQMSVSRTFIQCCRLIELFSNIISDNNHVDRKNSSCWQINFQNNLIVVLD